MQAFFHPNRKYFFGRTTRATVTCEGFEGWWNPVEKMLGQIDFGEGRHVLIAHSLPWDGAPGGRADTILRYTDRKDKKLVRDFLQNVKTLPPLVGECKKEYKSRCSPCASRTKQPVVFLSRYRDNIYVPTHIWRFWYTCIRICVRQNRPKNSPLKRKNSVVKRQNSHLCM